MPWRCSVFLLVSVLQYRHNSRQYLCTEGNQHMLHPISHVFKMLPLKEFKTGLISNGLILSFWGILLTTAAFFPLSSRGSMEGYPWLCASRKCLKLLNTLMRWKTLVMVALPISQSFQSLISFTLARSRPYRVENKNGLKKEHSHLTEDVLYGNWTQATLE